jgi:protease I
MSRKVLIITGDAGEGYEALYACHRLLEEGFQPVVAAPEKRRLRLIMHDFEPGWDTYVERPGYGIEADIAFRRVRTKDYAAVLILGGRAPEFLRSDPKVIEIVQSFDKAGKGIFAICHGIQILVTAGLVKGRSMTCYQHVRFELEQGGGQFRDQQAVRDGRFITAQNWTSHPDFYREVFRYLRESFES